MKKYYKDMLLAMKRSEDEVVKDLAKAYAKSLKKIKHAIAKEAAKDIVEGSEAHMSIQRLLSLQSQVENVIDNLYEDSLHKITGYGADLYRDRYYRAFYEIEDTLNINLNFAMINEREVEAAVDLPVGGLKLSERITGKNKRKTQKAIKEILVHSAITGEGYSDMADKLSRQLGISYNAAKRIVRTEGGRVSSMASLAAMKESEELGIEVEKQWLATLDNRTRDAHADLDGQVVGIDDNFEINGFEAPAPCLFGDTDMDVNCRCDVITIVEGISPDARLDNISKETIEYTDYEEWYDDRID